jgi:uncharacterized protein
MAVTRKLALVTGASAGIGAAFANVYAREGYDLAVTARRLDRLEALAAAASKTCGVEVIPIAADLGHAGAVDAILASIAAKGRVVDVLVNNAGYGLPGAWSETDWASQAVVLQVMLTAPLELSHKVLAGMKARRFGRIVNIASLAGFAPGGRGHTTYGAIKSALIKFSQSLHLEMDGTGVHATAVCPGFTYSEFHDVNGSRGRVSLLPAFMWQTAEEVAETGYQASEHNRAVVVTGAANKLIAGLAKMIPDPLVMQLMKGRAGRYRGASEG